MEEAVKTLVSLTNKNIDNLMRGKGVQLSAAQLKGKQHALALHPMNAKKVERARKSNKGVRLQMSPSEIDGSGLKEIWAGIKNAGKWIKDKIVDTPFYQENIKPMVRGMINTATDAIPNEKLRNLAKKGVEHTSSKFGAWGVAQSLPPNTQLIPVNMTVYLPQVLDSPGVEGKGMVRPAVMPSMPKSGRGYAGRGRGRGFKIAK